METMARSTMYQFRIDEEEKAETFRVFSEMGIKPAQAVRLFFRQVRITQSIPFPIEHIPNAEMRKVFEETDAGIDIHKAKDTEDLFRQLGL
jgi:DNA-damage-inducible protein J